MTARIASSPEERVFIALLLQQGAAEAIANLLLPIFQRSHKRGFEEAVREAARIARNGCLVPPDGGSPTEAEAQLCDGIAEAILALLKPNNEQSFTA